MNQFNALVLWLVVTGCATVHEAIESPETFAACKTVDIATTAAIINGGRNEMNPEGDA